MSDDFVSPKMQVVKTRILGEDIFFSVDQPKDHIQHQHLQGRFYEADELLIMSKVFPKGGRFLDIGANTGNHSIFFGKIMKAAHILPIEVNPRILGVLQSNILLNRLDDVCDLRHLGVGLHNETVENASVRFWEKNIGGGKVSTQGGELKLVRGDDIIQEPYDLVKIDVEGVELDVLAGLDTFITNFRPKMFVEVNNDNIDAFLEWVDRKKYQAVEEFRRYPGNTNYLISPLPVS